MRLYHKVHDGDGPYLLMVHGMLSSQAQWMLNLAALSKVCRPVVVELWGHGRSPAPAQPEQYRPEYYVQMFEDLRRELGAETWALCGQSMGAGLTWHYVLSHPERVTGHIFTNSSSAFADAETLQMFRDRAGPRSELIRELGHAALQKIPVHPVHARRMPEAVKQVMVADGEMHKPEAFIHTFANTSPYLSVRDRVAENQTPTLMVCGALEKRFKDARDWAEKNVPHMQIVDAEAGHAVNIQAPDDFDRAATAFISALAS